MFSYYKYSKTLLKVFFAAAVLGALVLFWSGKHEEQGDQLSEQALNISEEADKLRDKANRQAVVTADLKKQIEAKNREVEYWKTQSVTVKDLLELTKHQDEAIALRDEAIKSLTIENNELRSAIKLKDDAFKVQQDASQAYREAIYESKLKSAGLGLGLGLVVGLAIMKR